MADPYSLLTGDFTPTPEEETQARVAALRKQQGAAILAQLSGDPVLGKVGAGLAEGAQHGQDQLAQAQEHSLTRALEARKAQNEEDYRNKLLEQGRYDLFNGKDGETFMLDQRHGTTRPIAQATAQQMLGARGSAKAVPTAYFGEDIEPLHPEAPPRLADKEIQELRGSLAANQELGKKLSEFKTLISEATRTGRIIGPTAQRLTTLHEEIKPLWLEAKGLKRFTENENHLLDKALPVVSGAGAIVRPETAMAAIEQISGDATDSIGTKLHARGLRLKGAAAPAATAASPSPGKIHVSNGKETMEIDPADEAEAAKDGYRRI